MDFLSDPVELTPIPPSGPDERYTYIYLETRWMNYFFADMSTPIYDAVRRDLARARGGRITGRRT